MKTFYFTLIFLAFYLTSVFTQTYENDPLEDGYIIHNGGAEEIVSSTYYNEVVIYKYYKEMQLAPWDTIVPVLKYQHGRPDGIDDMITSDLDGDELSEIVKVWIENDVVKIAVLKPDPSLLSIDTLAQWQKVVELQK